MKRCGRCKSEKPLSEFNKDNRRKDGVGGWCKGCHSEYDRERYQTVDKNRKARNYAAQMERKRALLLEYLESHPCGGCDERDPVVLEFNHRDPAKKLANIAAMMSSHSWEKVLAEIEKCDVLCANCHRRHTAAQMGWWKVLGATA